MKYFLQSLLLAISSSLLAQDINRPSDLKEFGLIGNIKTATFFNYSAENLEKDSSKWRVRAHDTFTSKKVYYFNKRGNVDSIVSVIPYVSDGKTTLYYSYVYWEFNADGTKKRYQFYNNKKEVEQEAEIKWNDLFHYVQTNFSFDKEKTKQKVQEIWFTLSDYGRELSYEVKSFKPWNGQLKEHYIVLNTLKDGRYIQKKRSQFQIEPGLDELFYEYQKLDGNGNPTETVKLQSYNRKPKTMEVANYEYYK